MKQALNSRYPLIFEGSCGSRFISVNRFARIPQIEALSVTEVSSELLLPCADERSHLRESRISVRGRETLLPYGVGIEYNATIVHEFFVAIP